MESNPRQATRDTRYAISDKRPALCALLFALCVLSACANPPSPGAVEFWADNHIFCRVSYSYPAWSPDGTQIYYNLFDNTMQAAAGRSTDAANVHVMNANGGGDRLLIEGWKFPNPSPDGSMVLVERDTPPSGHVYTIIDVATGQSREIISKGNSAAWSPEPGAAGDSQWIAYALPHEDNGPIYKVNVDSGEVVTLTEHSGSDYFDITPLWSQGTDETGDGQKIAFASSRGGLTAVYLMDPDGENITPLPIPDEDRCPPGSTDQGRYALTWLPDGRSLATLRYCPTGSISVISTDGRLVADLSGLGEDIGDLTWSPDGTQILFTRDRTSVNRAIMIADSDGSHSRVLYPGGIFPSWSPDGSLIAFTGADKNNLSQIYTIRPDGTDLTQITTNSDNNICLR